MSFVKKNWWYGWYDVQPTWNVSWDSEVYLIQPFYLLWRYDMMWRKVQDLPWDQCLTKHLQYLQPIVTLWKCVIIFDSIIKFLIALILSLFLKAFFSCMRSSTVLAHWLRRVSSFYISYWIFQTQWINSQGRYR